MLVPPSAAVTVPKPHDELAFAGVAMTTPAGKLSTNARLEMPVLAFGLKIVNVSVDTLPGPMVETSNAFENVGGDCE